MKYSGHYQLADPSLSKFEILNRIMASSIYAGFYFIAVALTTKPWVCMINADDVNHIESDNSQFMIQY